MTTIRVEIKHRWTDAVLVSGNYESVCAAMLEAVKKGADLRSADLRSANLRSANLRSADLGGANLRSANLRSADLRSADLRSADLGGANLRSADLRSADLRSADLRDANLGGANLGGADLRSALGLEPKRITSLLLLLEQPAKLRLYKLVTADLMSPIQTTGKIRYEIGSTVEVANADLNPLVDCGAGVNVCDMVWALKEWQAGWRILVVEFEAKDIACIPTATDGKIRLHRCTVVGEKDLVELGLVAAAKGEAKS